MIVNIGEWQFDVDVSATRKVYRRTSRGSPTDCDCITCRNFAALGDSAYPVAFQDLAAELGIDFRKAAEIVQYFDFREGSLDYGGWFHCLGTMMAWPLDYSNRFDSPRHKLTGQFEILFDQERHVAFPEFGDRPLVRLVFYAREPWVLSEPYPG